MKCERLVLSFLLLVLAKVVLTQDYEVADVHCSLGDVYSKSQKIQARLRKPEHFRGHPVFADDLNIDPISDPHCQIQRETNDLSGRIYQLNVDDFSRCGVTRHSGYVHLRIWFPLLPHIMTSQDQEVILVCKPPEPTVLSSKTAELASTAPVQARVSGIVEEAYAQFQYQLAIFREAKDIYGDTGYRRNGSIIINPPISGPSYIVPLDEPVPIGTRLQLRATINPGNAWRYAKLIEVTVSPDPHDPHAEGHIRLVRQGCREQEMRSLMPYQPRRSVSKSNEVILDFEAVLLATNYTIKSRNEGRQWIHTTVLACVEERDCRPEICGDPVEPAGFGKKRRRRFDNGTHHDVQFDNRVPLRILLPQDSEEENVQDCRIWIITAGAMVSSTVISILILVITCLLHSKKKKISHETDQIGENHLAGFKFYNRGFIAN